MIEECTHDDSSPARRARRLARSGDRVARARCSLAFARSQAMRAGRRPAGRVGRVADFAGQLFAVDRRIARTTGRRSASTIRSPPATICGSPSDGRAEIDYGGGQFRLAGDTNVHVARLDDRQLALFIAQGRVIVRVRVLDPGEAARIDTPNTQIALTRPGLYRIDVARGSRSARPLVVREGEATVSRSRAACSRCCPGQSATVVATARAMRDVRYGHGRDGFDTWSANRDRRYERSRSANYVSRADGRLRGSRRSRSLADSLPDYGAVWYPTTVVAGWAPYRDGYWSEVGGWGRTWVDDAPWGYAPFHYGRWATSAAAGAGAPAPTSRVRFGRRRWSPGTAVRAGDRRVRPAQPVYGWVPLGWGEPYLPSWRRCSGSCWARYNRPYAVNVTVRPRARRRPATSNLAVPGALSAVPARTGATRAAGRWRRIWGTFPRRSSSAPASIARPPMAPRNTADARVEPGRARPVLRRRSQPAWRITGGTGQSGAGHVPPGTGSVLGAPGPTSGSRRRRRTRIARRPPHAATRMFGAGPGTAPGAAPATLLRVRRSAAPCAARFAHPRLRVPSGRVQPAGHGLRDTRALASAGAPNRVAPPPRASPPVAPMHLAGTAALAAGPCRSSAQCRARPRRACTAAVHRIRRAKRPRPRRQTQGVAASGGGYPHPMHRRAEAPPL